MCAATFCVPPQASTAIALRISRSEWCYSCAAFLFSRAYLTAMAAGFFEYGLERYLFPTLHSKVTTQAATRDMSCLQCLCELHARSRVHAIAHLWRQKVCCADHQPARHGHDRPRRDDQESWDAHCSAQLHARRSDLQKRRPRAHHKRHLRVKSP